MSTQILGMAQATLTFFFFVGVIAFFGFGARLRALNPDRPVPYHSTFSWVFTGCLLFFGFGFIAIAILKLANGRNLVDIVNIPVGLLLVYFAIFKVQHKR